MWWMLRGSVTFRNPGISRLKAELSSESSLEDCHWQSSPPTLGVEDSSRYNTNAK